MVPYNGEDETVEALMKKAVLDSYKAKDTGRDKIYLQYISDR